MSPTLKPQYRQYKVIDTNGANFTFVAHGATAKLAAGGIPQVEIIDRGVETRLHFANSGIILLEFIAAKWVLVGEVVSGKRHEGKKA